MATRCTIKIEGVNYAKVYKHWDGYPMATLKWLESFNKRFNENRGNDSSYKFAQLLRSSINNANEYDLDANEFTGWGVIEYNDNCGCDFEYTLLADGSVKTEQLS